ncbi:mesoderm-specific transcript protein [Strongylocentrotus purpuratus]|uniref:AB hydrolase-1 domain-containing protein n=1 Tax=Strongylocentrotus purpuratus TaxID=7668 RepID=A0A7M7LPG9_STRPU|nr:mesoderm-specific transcript protein [Strongylocentrotus purpuratus]
MGTTTVLLLTVLIACVAVFIEYPAPEFSTQVKEWHDTGKLFKFNGHNIFYKDEGNKQNEDVLVIFHGFPTCGYDFHVIWDGLLTQFGRVIMPDFLGYGFSDKPTDHVYSLFDKADMIEALLKNLGVSKVHILAHDMGDTVAQELIHRQNKLSEKVSRSNNELEIVGVCLSNGGIIPETIHQRLIQKILLKPYLGALAPYFTNRFLFMKGLGEVFGKPSQSTAEELFNQWTLSRHNNGHLVTHLLINYLRERYINRDRWVHALSETSIPLHLIYGPADPVNPKDPFLSTYKKLVPNSGVSELEPHISHYPQLEAPKEYLDACLQFFKSLQKS